MKNKKTAICLALSGIMASAAMMTGCGGSAVKGRIEIELIQYKPEAVAIFEQLEEEFNRTHDKIHLTIESPNDAMTILKTRLIREDYPDIIGIGGKLITPILCSRTFWRMCRIIRGWRP